MVEFNQLWASKAPVLVLNCYAKHFSHNAQPNPTAQYDLGQAVAYYSLEATDLGLFVHQMTGFDAAKAHKLLALNDEISVFSVTAMGYLGQVDSLPEDMQKMENAESPRMPQKEFLLNAL